MRQSYGKARPHPAEAERAALIEVGGAEQVKERVRDVRIGAALGAAVCDVRHGPRVVWRSPGYALVVRPGAVGR